MSEQLKSDQSYYCDGSDRGIILDNGNCSACGMPPMPHGFDPARMGKSAHLYDGLSIEEIVVGCSSFTGMAIASASDMQLREWARRSTGAPRTNELGLDGRALALRMVEAEIEQRSRHS